MNGRLPPVELGDALPLVTSSSPLPMPCLGVVMPVFNEAATVAEILRRVLDQPCVQEVVAVDDGSTDQTSAKLQELSATDQRVQIVSHAVNRGKGAAIRTALTLIKAPLVVIQDGDLEYDPHDFGRIIEPLRSGEALVVYGSRYLENSVAGQPRVFRWGVELLNGMVRIIYGVRLTDEATCYKATFTHLLRSLDVRSERFEFCSELTAKACRLGLHINEVPVSYHPRGHGKGKKIRLVDGVSAMRTLWRWRCWAPSTAANSAVAITRGNTQNIECSPNRVIRDA